MSIQPEPGSRHVYNNQNSQGNVLIQAAVNNNNYYNQSPSLSPISEASSQAFSAAAHGSVAPPSPASTVPSGAGRFNCSRSTIFPAPPSPNPQSYVPRQVLEDKMEEEVMKDCKAMDLGHAVVLFGLPDRGKTQLALNFFADHKHEYDEVAWIDYSDPGTLLQHFGGCLEKISSPAPRIEQHGNCPIDRHPYVTILHGHLETLKDRRWLIVFDGLSMDLIKVVPRSWQCTVIVTTQNRAVHTALSNRGTGARCRVRSPKMWSCPLIHVKGLSKEEAMTLILKRFSISDSFNPEADKIEDMCAKIAKVLGNTAYGIDLAGEYILDAYIGGLGCASILDSDDWYFLIERLECFLGSISDERHPIWKKKSPEYGKDLESMFDPILASIELADEGIAYQLLLFLSMFRRKSMERELFQLTSTASRDMLETFPAWLSESILAKSRGKWNTCHYDAAIKLLRNYDLIKYVKDAHDSWAGNCINALVYAKAQRLVKDNFCGMIRLQSDFLRVATSVPITHLKFCGKLRSHCEHAETLQKQHVSQCPSCASAEPLSGMDLCNYSQKVFESASTTESYGSSSQRG